MDNTSNVISGNKLKNLNASNESNRLQQKIQNHNKNRSFVLGQNKNNINKTNLNNTDNTSSRIKKASNSGTKNSAINRVASMGMQSVGVPKTVADAAVNSKYGQKTLEKAQMKTPAASFFNRMFRNKKQDGAENMVGYQNFVLDSTQKKSLIGIAIIGGMIFLIFIIISVAVEAFRKTIPLGLGDAVVEKAIEELNESLEKEFDLYNGSIYGEYTIYSIKYAEPNLLAVNTKNESYISRKYNIATIKDIDEFYPPVTRENAESKSSAYDFYYKLYNLNKYYSDICGKAGILDVPLLISTLKIQSDDMYVVFEANLNEYDKSSKARKSYPEFQYNYNWSNSDYISTKTESYDDMAILAKHMVKVTNTGSGNTCEFDAEGYKEFLKEFIEYKYYLDGYSPNNEESNSSNDGNSIDTSNSCTDCTDFASKFITWLVNIAEDDTHGYSQGNRYGNPDYDCSSLVYYGLLNSGFTTKQIGEDAFTTVSEREILKKAGFTEYKFTNQNNLLPGDILWRKGHTEVYIGNGLNAAAHISETGGKYGKGGDQTGNEINVSKFSKSGSWTYVYRYEG